MSIRTSLVLLALSCLIAACIPVPAPAQTDSQLRAILLLTGASGEEDLDEQELERLLSLLSHPLQVNLSSRSRLLSSGLLTQYQVASLLDYRQRSGDILSLSELSLVEGFGAPEARTLAPFLSFQSRSLPGTPQKDSLDLSHDLTLRGGVKDGDWCYGAKYRLSISDNAELSLAARTSYSDGGALTPSSWSSTFVLYGRRRLGKLLVGDFNTRFGQGLSLWSGMSMGGFSNSNSFYRRPSGLSASWSYSGIGSHRGLAADFLFGRFVLSTFLSFPGLREWCEKGKPPEVSALPGANLAWLGRNGQVSLTAFCGSAPFDRIGRASGGGLAVLPEGWKGSSSQAPEEPSGLPLLPESKVSVDFRRSFGSFGLFGEAAWDVAAKSGAAVAGILASLPSDSRLSLVVRAYPESFSSDRAGAVRAWTRPTNEYAAALGLERKGAVLTADLARKADDPEVRQCKLLLKVPVQLGDRCVLSVRASERFRPGGKPSAKTSLRCDIDFSSSGISSVYGPSEGDSWRARFRMEAQKFLSHSALTYLEAGRKTGWYSAYLRGTLFFVDNWDDRIYSYERDAPGNFTVPALYGRGYSLSAVIGARLSLSSRRSKALRLYFRASRSSYSLMEVPKPSSWEAKLQAVFSL